MGLIPICSGCGGGRLRFDRNTVIILLFRVFIPAQDIWKTLLLFDAIKSSNSHKSKENNG